MIQRGARSAVAWLVEFGGGCRASPAGLFGELLEQGLDSELDRCRYRECRGCLVDTVEADDRSSQHLQRFQRADRDMHEQVFTARLDLHLEDLR